MLCHAYVTDTRSHADGMVHAAVQGALFVSLLKPHIQQSTA